MSDTNSDQSSKRRMHVFAVLLVLIGAGAWFAVRPLFGPSEAEWNARMSEHSLALIQLVRPDPFPEDSDPQIAIWEAARGDYDAKRLSVLRQRLMAFIDFELAEYADAKEIYLSGKLPDKPSDRAREAQDRLRVAFGNSAQPMIDQFRDRVREAAYRASPAVGGGADPASRPFDEEYDRLVTEWAPAAKARALRLTTPER